LFFDKAPSGYYRIGPSGQKKNSNRFGMRTLDLTIKVKKISIFIKRVIYEEVNSNEKSFIKMQILEKNRTKCLNKQIAPSPHIPKLIRKKCPRERFYALGLRVISR
jgi:hypothetical protein